MSKRFVRTKIDIENKIHEVLIEVPETEAPPWPGDHAVLSVVGRPHPRVDGVEKVTGEAKYTYDLRLTGMLHGKILFSRVARGRVKKVDLARALSLSGVRAAVGAGDIPEFKTPSGDPWKVFDPEIRFEGQEVAAVCAEDEKVAEDALRLIEVEYEEQPFVHTIQAAMRQGAPQLSENGNVRQAVNEERGSAERGFAEADVVVEEAFSTQVNLHQCLEAHATVADWDSDHLTVYASTQGVFPLRTTLAALLEMPLSRIRVVMHHMGGGFGSKLNYDASVLDRSTMLAILLSKRTGRPVKFVHDRENESKNTGHRPATVQHFKAGARKDGTLTAIHLRTWLSLDDSCSNPTVSVYACPNVKVEEHEVSVNYGAPRPTRAPGNVQNTFALEMTMERLADRLGMDPLEIRRVNYARTDPRDGRPWALKGLEECYRIGSEKIGWARRNPKPGRGPLATGARRRGIGCATGIWGGAGGAPASAIVRINPDGSAHVLTGTQDVGTGTKTIMAMIAAEELGVRLEDVQITVGDTDLCPPGPLSGGSLTAPSVGPAVRNAAADARERLFALALAVKDSPLGAASTEDLEAVDGWIRVRSDPGRRVEIRKVAAAMGRDYIFGTGVRGPNPRDVSISTWTAQFAEVEADMETGIVQVKRIVSVQEVGRVLNPLTASSQVEGGVIQGMAFALHEDRIMDRTTGRAANPNLHDYKLPTAREIPDIEAIFVDAVDARANSVGAKGLGEPPIVPTAAAIAAAVYNATGAFVRDLPLTPDKVLAAIENPAPAAAGRRS